MAAYVEHQGAYGVVCNSKIGVDTICAIKEAVEIPVVYTVISEKMDIEPYLVAGVDFVNVSGAARTPEIVAALRAKYPELPIIATGGPTEESHHWGGCQRHHLYAAQQRGVVCQDHGQQPQ